MVGCSISVSRDARLQFKLDDPLMWLIGSLPDRDARWTGLITNTVAELSVAPVHVDPANDLIPCHPWISQGMFSSTIAYFQHRTDAQLYRELCNKTGFRALICLSLRIPDMSGPSVE